MIITQKLDVPLNFHLDSNEWPNTNDIVGTFLLQHSQSLISTISNIHFVRHIKSLLNKNYGDVQIGSLQQQIMTTSKAKKEDRKYEPRADDVGFKSCTHPYKNHFDRNYNNEFLRGLWHSTMFGL